MRRPPNRALLLLTMSLCMVATAHAQPNSDIINSWVGSAQVRAQSAANGPWLIPIQLLITPYESWSPADRQRISKDSYAKFHAKVAEIATTDQSGKCDYSAISLYEGGKPKEVGLFRLAEINSDVVLGKVEKVVPVWDRILEKVASLVYLRVDETLKGAIPVGTVVRYFRSDGLVRVGRVVLCSRFRDWTAPPQKPREDEVTWLSDDQYHLTYLIVGNLSQDNKWLIETSPPYEFKVNRGSAFEAGEPTGLNEIYERLATYQAVND
jgi:hypothetical protein